MFLGIDRLLELVNDPETRLVQHLSERELHNPEGTGFDLRIGKLSRLIGSGYLGVDERQTSRTEVVAQVHEERGPVVVLEPQDYYLATTIEVVNMPRNLVGMLCPRGTLFRSGVVLLTGQINPGYSGTLTFGMYDASNVRFELELGARIVHVLVAEVDGITVPYRGQWQGGRISAEREQQV